MKAKKFFFKSKSEMQANKKKKKKKHLILWVEENRKRRTQRNLNRILNPRVCVYFILFLSKSKHTLKAALQLSNSLHSGLFPPKHNTPP